jgi:hypothetical protein
MQTIIDSYFRTTISVTPDEPVVFSKPFQGHISLDFAFYLKPVIIRLIL